MNLCAVSVARGTWLCGVNAWLKDQDTFDSRPKMSIALSITLSIALSIALSIVWSIGIANAERPTSEGTCMHTLPYMAWP